MSPSGPVVRRKSDTLVQRRKSDEVRVADLPGKTRWRSTSGCPRRSSGRSVAEFLALRGRARRPRRGAAAAAGERDHRPGGGREDAARRTAPSRTRRSFSAASTCSRRTTSMWRSSGPPGSRRRGWAARSRCGRWWSGSAARAGLPRGVGPRPGQPDRLPRRLRSRRGSRAGGVRDRRRALAADGRACQSGRVADDDGAQPGDRPAASRPHARREDAPAGAARGGGGGDGGADVPGRAAGADLHLLPSGAGAGGAGGVDAAHAGRVDDRGDRARLPRSRGDDEAAADAGEGQDQDGRDPLQPPRRPPCSRTGWPRCWRWSI